MLKASALNQKRSFQFKGVLKQTQLNWMKCSLPSIRLAGYDVVVTTYSLVSKEAPVQKEDAEKPSKDTDHVVSHL